LNQYAAFRDVIPYGDGAVNLVQGATHNAGLEHNLFHGSLEKFWDLFREGGPRFRELPTCAEYHEALIKALVASGKNPEEAAALADLAKANREAFQLLDTSKVPRIPARTNVRSD